MTKPELLPRREQEAMDIIFEIGSGTAGEIQNLLPGAPSYSAARGILSRLVKKGKLEYHQDGPRYIYSPAVPVNQARSSALKKVIDTFFGGSSLQTMTALVGITKENLTEEQIAELEKLVAEAKQNSKGQNDESK